RPIDCLAHGLIHGKKIGAIDALGGHTEAANATRNILAAHGVIGAGALAIAVVLQYESGRNLQYARHAHRLEPGALIRAAVPAEGDADASVAADLARYRCSDGERRAAADDCIGAQHAFGHVRDVHRAAFALAQPVTLPIDFLHHANHVASF